MGAEITAKAVRTQTFARAPAGHRGYSEDDVNAHLELIADALDGRRHMTAPDVRNVVFKTTSPIGRSGYDAK